MNFPGNLEGIQIFGEFAPGDLGHLIQLHGLQNQRDYGFNHVHEAYCARIAADFILVSKKDRSKVWLAKRKGEVVGSVFIFEVSNAAQLRLLFVDEAIRGFGLGRWLVHTAVQYACSAGFDSVFLWTVIGIDRAVTIYEGEGFRKTDEKLQADWGQKNTEARYELIF
jgi:GNAT superfamily N-acetyltransferase